MKRTATREITKRRPASSRYEIAWHNPVTTETVKIRITHTRDYLARGQDHIEIEARNPQRAALPITETGYRSHFMPALELVNAGGPVSFVTAWIERETKSKAWLAAATAKAQGDLFGWADSKREATAKKRTAPRRRVVPDLDAIADREFSDGQRAKRMAQRDRGKTPKPPRGP